MGGGGGGGGTVTDVTGTNGVQVTSGTTTPLVRVRAVRIDEQDLRDRSTARSWTCVAFPSGGGNVSGTGTANQTVKWTGGSTVGNAWATDDGTTWGSASIFTITEASGNTKAFGTLESAGIFTADTSISLPTAGTSTFAAFANGSGAAASATATGRIIYDNTNHTFDVSANAGGYVALLTGTPGAVGITGTVSSNNIPRGASASSLQTGSFTDSGTAVSTGSTLTLTGALSANDTLVLASGTAANNTATFANGSGATVGALIRRYHLRQHQRDVRRVDQRRRVRRAAHRRSGLHGDHRHGYEQPHHEVHGHVDRRKRLGVRRRHDVGLGIDLHEHGSVRQHQSVRHARVGRNLHRRHVDLVADRGHVDVRGVREWIGRRGIGVRDYGYA